MRVFLCAFLALAVAACADGARSPFDPAAAAFIHSHGKGTIEGKAFTTNELGYVIYAAGQRVYLIPATAYAQERYEALYFGWRDLPPWMPEWRAADPRFRDFIRSTVADATGGFRFEGLAPGTYLVETRVIWRPPNRLLPDGKKMFEPVIVTGQETEPVKIIVSGA